MWLIIVNKSEDLRDLIWYIIIGVLSGTVELGRKEHVSKTKFEQFTVWLSSICSAMFLTDTLVWILEYSLQIGIPHKVRYGACLFSAQFGSKIFIFLINTWRTLDWKSILMAFINKKNEK